jgi:hypothetical protein
VRDSGWSSRTERFLASSPSPPLPPPTSLPPPPPRPSLPPSLRGTRGSENAPVKTLPYYLKAAKEGEWLHARSGAVEPLASAMHRYREGGKQPIYIEGSEASPRKGQGKVTTSPHHHSSTCFISYISTPPGFISIFRISSERNSKYGSRYPGNATSSGALVPTGFNEFSICAPRLLLLICCSKPQVGATIAVDIYVGEEAYAQCAEGHSFDLVEKVTAVFNCQVLPALHSHQN